MPIIKDWVVQVQWDDKRVRTGVKKLDAIVKKIGKGHLKQETKLQRAKERTLLKERKMVDQNARSVEKHKNSQFKADKRALDQQQRYMNNLDAIDRKLRRQQRLVQGRPGGGQASASIQMQRERIRGVGAEALAAGSAFALTPKHSNTLRVLRENAALTGKEVGRLTRQLTAQEFAAQGLNQSFRNLARSYISVFAVMAGSVGLYRVGEDLEQIKASLIATSGSAEQVGKDWEFITDRAIALGSDLNVAAKGYQQISIAARTMGKSQEEAKNIFLASQEAAAAFNLSVDDASGYLLAA